MEHDRAGLLNNQHNQDTTTDTVIHFKPIRTPFITVFQIILTIALEIEVFLLPVLWTGKNPVLSDFSIILLSHSAVWFIFLLADRYIRYEHNVSRCRGYLEFYTKTKELRRIPILTVSTGSTFLLVFIVLWHDLLKHVDNCENNDRSDHCEKMQKYRNLILEILISLQCMVLLIALMVYLVRTCQFNRSERLPDVVEQDCNSTALSGSMEIGFRDETMTEEVVEKQAEMIRYLQEHNAQLGKRVLQLTAAQEQTT